MSKFELFMGCLGNGTVVCNKAVRENGDYKKIAHISEHGHIRWYISTDHVPKEALERIETVAAQDKKEFLERWNKKSYLSKWDYMMNIPTIGCGYSPIELVNKENRHLSMEERVKLMEIVFFDTHM